MADLAKPVVNAVFAISGVMDEPSVIRNPIRETAGLCRFEVGSQSLEGASSLCLHRIHESD